MKKAILAALFPLILFGCSSDQTESKYGIKKSTIKAITIELTCFTLKNAKNMNVQHFAQSTVNIFKKHGIDPQDQEKMNNVNLAIEELKNDEQFKKEIQEEIMTSCMKQ